MPLPLITLIAARARNGVIGRNNALPWHLPEDLKHFRQQTMGHTVLLGRKTWESIGRPLPGRQMVVISRQPLDLPEGVGQARSLDEAIARHADEAEVFVMGAPRSTRWPGPWPVASCSPKSIWPPRAMPGWTCPIRPSGRKRPANPPPVHRG